MLNNSFIVCELGRMAFPQGDGVHDYDGSHNSMFERIMSQWFLPQFEQDVEFLGETVTVCRPGTHGLIARLMMGERYRVALVITPYIYLRPKGKKKPDASFVRGELLTDKHSKIQAVTARRGAAIAQHLGLFPKAVLEDAANYPTIFYPSVISERPLDRFVLRLYPYTQLEFLRENDVRQKAGELAHIISEVYSLED